MSPNQAPPERYEGTPRRFVLPEATRLTRIHSTAFGVTDFNPSVARSSLRGGRFDSTPHDPYAFLYAAGDDATAVCEVLLRDLPVDERGARALPRAGLSQLRISWLSPTRDLELVNLRTGTDLAAAAQDAWLTVAPSAEYPMTRRWSSALRRWAPWASGLTWRSRREPGGFSYIFFGDRCPSGCFEEMAGSALRVPRGHQSLDDPAALLYIEQILASSRVTLM